MPAVSVSHLAKSYGDVVAVKDVTFDVEKGEVFALLARCLMSNPPPTVIRCLT
jgi:ABC-2 type transport system ATP-binding protein